MPNFARTSLRLCVTCKRVLASTFVTPTRLRQSTNSGNLIQGVNSRRAISMKEIEVERKFRLSPNCKIELESQGARQTEHVTFNDRYYDTTDFRLALNDAWLRQRDLQWQLKYKPEWQKKTGAQSKTSQYVETCSADEIISVLARLLQENENTAKNDQTFKSVESFLVANNIQLLADYQTTRSTYVLNDLRIDFDETDFGYSLGEIEAVVGDETEVDEALTKIDQLGAKLGIQSETRTPGKIDVYLQKRRPQIYEKFIEACVCVQVTDDNSAHDKSP